MSDELKRKRLRYLQLKAKAGMGDGPEEKLESLPEKGIDTGLLDAAKQEYQSSPMSKVTDAATGFAKGASLGTLSLIPKFKEEADEAKERSPVAFGTGEVASLFTPGGGTAGAFKVGGNVAAKATAKGLGAVAAKKVGGKTLEKAIGAGVGGLITGGVKGATESGTLDIGRGVKQAATEGVTSAITAGAFDKLSPVLKKKATKFINTVLKPKNKAIARGFEAQDILDLEVSGTVNETIKKSTKNIDVFTKAIDSKVDQFVKANPNKKVYSNDFFIKTIKKIREGSEKTILADEKDLAETTVKKIFNGLQSSKKLGDLDAKGLRELKSELGKIAFKKTTELTDDDIVRRKAAKLIWKNVADEFERFVPDAAEDSKKVSKLLNIKDVAIDAADRIGKKNSISIRDMMLLAAGGVTIPFVGPVPASVVVAGVAGKKAMETGKGGQVLNWASKATGSPMVQKGAAKLTGKYAGDFMGYMDDKQKNIRAGGGRRF